MDKGCLKPLNALLPNLIRQSTVKIIPILKIKQYLYTAFIISFVHRNIGKPLVFLLSPQPSPRGRERVAARINVQIAANLRPLLPVGEAAANQRFSII